jgi:hypothetical protein
MLDALANLKEEGRVKAADAAGKIETEFGLKEPRLRLDVKMAKDSWQLAVGSDAAVAEKVYARVGNDEDVMIIGTGIVEVFSKPTLQFRDKRIARFESYKLRAAEVHTHAGVITLERQGSVWKVKSPYDDNADMIALDNLLRVIQDCNAERFEADGLSELDFARFGLAQDGWRSARVVLTLADSDKPVEILFGDPVTDAPDLVFVRNMSFPNVCAVKTTILETLKTPPGAFRSRGVFSFNPDDVWKVQIRNAKILAEVEKMPIISWVTRLPVDYDFDERRVTDFVQRLARLQVLEIAAEEVDDPDKFGLLVPAYNLTVSIEEQVADGTAGGGPQGGPVFRKREEILHVGIVDGRYFGQVDGQSKVVALPSEFVELLSRGYLNFTSLRMNDIFASDVESVEFSMGEKYLRIRMTENLTLTVAESRNLKMPVHGVQEAVGTFRSLSAADIIAGKIILPCPWLDAPYLVIKTTLRTEPQGATLTERKLIISKKDEKGRHLAYIEGEDLVYVLEEGKVVAMAMPLTRQ